MIAPFPDHCLLVPFFTSLVLTYIHDYAVFSNCTTNLGS